MKTKKDIVKCGLIVTYPSQPILAYSSLFQHIAVYSSLFQSILAFFSTLQPNPVYFKPILDYSIIFQPSPCHSSIFQPNPAYSSIFQHIPACSNLFLPIPAYSSIFKPIVAYSRLFQHISCSRLFSSPECLVQRVEGTTTSVLLPGFSVASLRLALKFLEVGEVTMATHQWEEVAMLLRALELSSEV